jgi:hypothetical protein
MNDQPILAPATCDYISCKHDAFFMKEEEKEKWREMWQNTVEGLNDQYGND